MPCILHKNHTSLSLSDCRCIYPSDRAAFKEHVLKVDALFCEAELDGTRYIIACEATDEQFKLSLVDVVRHRVAERELSFDLTNRTVRSILLCRSNHRHHPRH